VRNCGQCLSAFITDRVPASDACHAFPCDRGRTGNGISKLVFTILSAVAENERDRIRERIRDVKRDRASRRLFNGGRRPFGYDIDGEGKEDRRLVPNAHEQAALARGRALRDEGKTFRDIADAWVSEFGMPKFDAKSSSGCCRAVLKAGTSRMI
jgi:putative DNA-invertase from lambdoid prophage Rac